MPFNRDQSTAIRRKGREPPRVARASSAANLQVNALLGNFQGQVDNIMRSLTDQLEQEDAHDAGAAPVGPTEYAMATSSGHKDEHEDDTYQPPYQPPSAVRRLLLIDKQVSPHGHLANAALDCVTVIKYDSEDTTLEELLELIRFTHRKQGFPFTSIACAQHGPNEEGLWIWTSDLVVDLGGGSPLSPITQLTPIVEALGMALEKTRMGRAHIDFLACGLAGFAPRLVLGLEKLYGIDFRASTDDTGNDVNGGDWKMETDNDYDVAVDYLDRVKLVAYTEKMAAKPVKGIVRALRQLTTKGKATNKRKDDAKDDAKAKRDAFFNNSRPPAAAEPQQKAEFLATKSYCGNGYKLMNRALRTPDSKPTEKTLENIDNFASALKRVMEKKNMTLHRGISGQEMAEKFGPLKADTVFTDLAFSSTSASLEVGKANATCGGVLITIKASVVSSIAKITGNAAEGNEFVFLPGSKFKVLSNKKGKGGKSYAHHITVQQTFD